MRFVSTIRRVLRAMLLRLAAWLEERPSGPMPVMMTSGGPPAHWVERVRKAAPQLIASNDVATRAANAPPPPRVVPRVGVPRGSDVQTARAALRLAPAPPAFAKRSDASTPVPAPRKATSPTVDATPAQQRAVLPMHSAQTRAVAVHCAHEVPVDEGHRWPELDAELPSKSNRPVALSPDAPVTRTHDEPVSAQAIDRWPQLPEHHEPRIETLDDAGHLRRITHEQRGDAWSE